MIITLMIMTFKCNKKGSINDKQFIKRSINTTSTGFQFAFKFSRWSAQIYVGLWVGKFLFLSVLVLMFVFDFLFLKLYLLYLFDIVAYSTCILLTPLEVKDNQSLCDSLHFC